MALITKSRLRAIPHAASVIMRDASFGLYLACMNVLLCLPGHRLRLFIVRSVGRNSVGPRTSLERGVRLTWNGGVRIGTGCNINRGTELDGRGGLRIGDLVNIAPDVRILTASHDVHDRDFGATMAEVVIDDRAWLATRAMVLPGVTIGEGAVVGAGSVVTKDVPPWTIVAGNPARPIGQRSADAQINLPVYRRWFA